MGDMLSGLLNDFLVMTKDKNSETEMWREKPVDLLTFFRDDRFLNEQPFPGKQTQFLEFIGNLLWYKLDVDKSVCPPIYRNINEYAALFGKGSGKDFLASGILVYVCYLLCCMNDPHRYFGFGQDEPIDLINVAINSYQANNVFFKKFRARITNCKWFKKVLHNPTEVAKPLPNEFQITKSQIRFYKNITAHSIHSDAGSSFEGFSPLVVIFDEIGGFEIERAKSCYNTLRSSAVTRYNDKIFLLFISFPRSADDFMMTKFNQYADGTDNQVHGMRGASWEVNPNIKEDSLAVIKDYETDPEGARMRYETIPPLYRNGLFQFPEKIDDVVSIGKSSQCPALIIQEKITTRQLHNGEERHFIGLELFNLTLNPAFTYYIGGDAGVKTDSYIVTLYHAETVHTEVIENGELVTKAMNKPIEDLILEWRPNKKDRLPVDLINVADILEMICQQVFVKKAIFDKFNSAEVVQRLMQYGVEAEDKSWSNPFQLQIYQHLKGLIYTGLIELLDYKSMYEGQLKVLSPNEEIKALKIINGIKIDHDPDKTKDFSDARAGAIYICSTDEAVEITNFAMPLIVGAKR